MLQKKEERELEQQILGMADLLIENTIATSMLVGDAQGQYLEKSCEIVAKMAELLEQYLGGHAEHLETLLQQLTQQKLPDENVLESFGDFNSHLDTAIRKGLALYQGYSLNDDPSYGLQEDGEEKQLTETAAEQDSEQKRYVDTAETVERKNTREKVDTDIGDNMVNEDNHLVDMVAIETLQEEFNFPKAQEIDQKFSTIELPMFENTSEELHDNSYKECKEEENRETKTEYSEPQNDAMSNYYIEGQWDLALKQVFPDAIINKDYSIKGITFSYFLPDLSLAIDTTPPEKKEAVWKEYYCRQKNILLLSINANKDARYRHLVRTIKRSLAENAAHY